jgi:hypothetical protein
MNPLNIENMRINCSQPGAAQLRAVALFEISGKSAQVELIITDLSVYFGDYVLPYDIEQVAMAIATHVQQNKIQPPLDWDELIYLAGVLGRTTGSVFWVSDDGDSYALTEEFAERDTPSKLIFRTSDIVDAWQMLKAKIAVARIMQEINQ